MPNNKTYLGDNIVHSVGIVCLTVIGVVLICRGYPIYSILAIASFIAALGGYKAKKQIDFHKLLGEEDLTEISKGLKEVLELLDEAKKSAIDTKKQTKKNRTAGKVQGE